MSSVLSVLTRLEAFKCCSLHQCFAADAATLTESDPKIIEQWNGRSNGNQMDDTGQLRKGGQGHRYFVCRS